MKVGANAKRKGISEFMGALIMIAITLVAGSAALGWIFSESGTSQVSYGNSVAQNVNFLNERFTLVSEAFYNTGNTSCPSSGGVAPNYFGACNLASFWLFNTGSVQFTLFSIQIKSLATPPDGNKLDVVFSQSGFTINSPSGPLFTGCSNTDAGDGFPGLTNGFKPTSLLAQQTLSSPYRISIPSCPGGHLYLFDGTSYSVTLTGLYGNIVSQPFTPNG